MKNYKHFEAHVFQKQDDGTHKRVVTYHKITNVKRFHANWFLKHCKQYNWSYYNVYGKHIAKHLGKTYVVRYYHNTNIENVKIWPE